MFGGFLSSAHRPDLSGQPPWDFSFLGWQLSAFAERIPDAVFDVKRRQSGWRGAGVS